ncbi:MAG: hypothetical protein KDF60_20380, partial [Calditrichaeota bacterium]|nr:hypothetical protein [Calditrichota bacterium]
MIKKSVLLFLFITSLAISQTTTTTQYSQLQQNLCKGWNTWNIHSVLSHVLLPQGIAINLGIKEYADGSYLKEALIGRSGNDQEEILPGPRSYDGSYSELIIKWQKIELKIQSAARSDTLVLLITPIKNQFKPASLIAEGGLLWGRPGYVVREKNVLKWYTDHKEIQLYSTVTPVTETNINANTPYLALPLENEIGLSTAGMVSLPEIKDYINQARKKVIKQENSFAADKDIYIPMHRTLAWNLIYDPENNRVIIPISRNWYWGGFVLFDWDTYFSAYMLSV